MSEIIFDHKSYSKKILNILGIFQWMVVLLVFLYIFCLLLAYFAVNDIFLTNVGFFLGESFALSPKTLLILMINNVVQIFFYPLIIISVVLKAIFIYRISYYINKTKQPSFNPTLVIWLSFLPILSCLCYPYYINKISKQFSKPAYYLSFVFGLLSFSFAGLFVFQLIFGSHQSISLILSLYLFFYIIYFVLEMIILGMIAKPFKDTLASKLMPKKFLVFVSAAVLTLAILLSIFPNTQSPAQFYNQVINYEKNQNSKIK